MFSGCFQNGVGKKITKRTCLWAGNRETGCFNSMKSSSFCHKSDKGLIVVIDDEPLILQMTQTILEREGYDVETALSAEEAKATISRFGCYTRALYSRLWALQKK